MKSLGILNIRENLGANSLLNFFEFLYYINRRFSLTTGQLYVPDGEKPDEVKGKKTNIKNYTKSLGGVLHTV